MASAGRWTTSTKRKRRRIFANEGAVGIQRKCAQCEAEAESEGTIQRKCAHCEAEAEGEGMIQRKCAQCEEEEEGDQTIQRQAEDEFEDTG